MGGTPKSPRRPSTSPFVLLSWEGGSQGGRRGRRGAGAGGEEMEEQRKRRAVGEFGDQIAEVICLRESARPSFALPLSPPMAQTATMGPPLSPRETRRSGRRSAPSHSTSTSTSPDSAPDLANIPTNNGAPAHNAQGNNHRPALTSTNSSSRNKRNKRDGTDDTALDEPHKNGPNTVAPSVAAQNGRSKRKGKEKDRLVIEEIPVEFLSPQIDTPTDVAMDLLDAPPEEDSVTRCVCGSTGTSISPLLLSSRFASFLPSFLISTFLSCFVQAMATMMPMQESSW